MAAPRAYEVCQGFPSGPCTCIMYLYRLLGGLVAGSWLVIGGATVYKVAGIEGGPGFHQFCKWSEKRWHYEVQCIIITVSCLVAKRNMNQHTPASFFAHSSWQQMNEHTAQPWWEDLKHPGLWLD